MFRWTLLLLLLLSAAAAASGSSIARSLFSRLEGPRPAHPSNNCTDDNNSVTVKCHSSIRESMCCSFGLLNSSQPCAASTSTSEPTLRSDCAPQYELTSCEGHGVRLMCSVALRCGESAVAWRHHGSAAVFQGRELRMTALRRADAGDYLCQVTDDKGVTAVRARVAIAVQFPPELNLPERSGDLLECRSEALPSARIRWLLDGQPLPPPTTAQPSLCGSSSAALLRLSPGAHNYTCVAENEHGQATASLFLLQAPEEEEELAEPGKKRRFNVTGFIVGMLPPLFISFYIILKLGYRSRYAEERPEDEGFGEEPFFISY